ncbi:MAG: hypothetical protein MJ133_00715 [Lachnospiraceae bacterium]|nr:hypothetical protein [Lachnospiraceae bacterium]
MKYFFKGKMKEDAGSYCIALPFNVWEVNKKREHISATLMVDNNIINCELTPANQDGSYVIRLTSDDVKNIDVKEEHNFLIEVSGSLIRMNQNSPYSLENPIRKIDDIDIIIQPIDGTCGQTVVAMLAGNTIAEVCSEMGCREWQATMGHVISALNYYGIDHSHVIVFTEGKETTLPRCAILMEKMGRFCHYLLYFKGKYYDPNDGIFEEYDTSKLLGYLEIRLGE